MKLLAIDPGSNKCGVAIFDGTTLISTMTLTSKEKTPTERRLSIALSLQHVILSQFDLTGSNLIISEEPLLMGRNNNGMQRLLGYIEYLTDGKVVFIHPMTIKKAMGHGGKDKFEVALAAGEKLKTKQEQDLVAALISSESWDETDAVAVALTFFERRAQ